MTAVPTVSVLMTAYNRPRFVVEAIESVLASSFEDFELIVVDDCSTDDTYDTAHAYERRDPRVRVLRNERNLGDYPNRNRALGYARGRYTKFVDSDDILYPHGLGVMVRAMDAFPDAVAGISQGDAQLDRPYPIRLTPAEAYDEHFFRRGILFMGPTACIYRTEMFRAAGAFSEVRHNGDALTTLRLARIAPIVKIAPGLFWWREHEGQEFRRRTERQLIEYEILRDALEHADCPLPPERRQQALDRLRHAYARQLLSQAVRRGRPRFALDRFRRAALPLRYLARALVRPT
jgi:glycosyltransferase involved in cell wall biosynthesis